MAEIIPLLPDQVNTCVGSVKSSNKLVSRTIFICLVLIIVPTPASAWEESCSPFKEIYKNGKDLCETIFGESFKYSTEEDKAFTMWWFGGKNPNKQAAKNLGLTVPDTCQLQYFHKQKPSPESDDFTECLPWKSEACCQNSTVTTADAIKKAYGPGYEWDRCGPMSPECERFFVQEACLYECDLTAGMYRKCTDQQVAAAGENKTDQCYQNTWELKHMPIKASYCDAWYDSCRNDYFCNGGDSPGNFFSCNAFYWENSVKNKAKKEQQRKDELAKAVEEKDSLSTELVIVIVCAAALVVIILVFIGYIVRREKQGKPIFTALPVPTAEE